MLCQGSCNMFLFDKILMLWILKGMEKPDNYISGFGFVALPSQLTLSFITFRSCIPFQIYTIFKAFFHY